MDKRVSNKQKLAPAFILAGASLWGILGIFVRKLNMFGLTNSQTIMCRAFVVAAVLILYLAVFDRKKLKIHIRDIWMFLGTGILSIVLFNLCYFYTIKEMSLSAACIFLYTAPGFVMVLSAVLFREKITRKKTTALLLAFSGCVCVSGIIGGTTTVSAMGIFMGLGSGFCYSLYSIFGKYASEKYPSETTTAYTFLIAFLSMLPFGKPVQTVQLLSHNSDVLILLLLLGIVSSFLPYYLYTAGLKYVEPGKASIMASAEPMVATLCGIFVYHEKMTVMNGLGIVLILMSVAALNVKTGKETSEREE